MKFVEPISSAVLVTACVYSAGISQNNAFLRAFNLHSEFSQPALDRILYDGGIIFCDIIFGYFKSTYGFLANYPYSIALGLITLAIFYRKNIPASLTKKLSDSLNFVVQWSGALLVLFLFYMTFAAYDKGQEDGLRIAKILLNNCYEIKVTSGDKTSTGCAFRKDKDSIWYYTSTDKFKVFSETLSETSKVEYSKPLPRSLSSQGIDYLEQATKK
ncbi:hypothetical protein D3C77_242490 [compost metagenome]|jgi:hypothetical protein